MAYNQSMHGTMRYAPADIEDNEVLQYLVVSDIAKKYAHNKKLAKKRMAKAEETGAFRRPKKATAFGRGFQAKFGDKETLEGVQDGTLLKARGDERLIDVKSIASPCGNRHRSGTPRET